MSFKHAIVFVLLIMSVTLLAQENRYMVFFKDKNGIPYTIGQPQQFLSQKSIDRRLSQGLEVAERDLPVNETYVDGVGATGAKVFFRTKWMNGLLVQCTPEIIATVEALDFIDHIEFVAPQPRLLNGGRSKGIFRKKNDKAGERTQTQLQMLGIPDMHADGYHGEGITIAVLDGGFIGVNQTQPFQQIFSEGRFDNVISHDFVRNTKNVFQYDDHGSQVFSVIAANVPDDFTGGAYGANFQLYVTEDASSEYRIEEYNWMFAAERADSSGVDIISSSLGYYDFDIAAMNYSTAQMDGKTTIVTRAAQWAADRGIVVVCSAGNEGNIQSWKIITAPADAVDVIAVANVNSSGAASSSSSRGPSADGRIKPDLAAMGSSVSVIQDNGSPGTASGTSLSAPLITSLVAGVMQRFPGFSAKQIISALKSTASRATNPDNIVGYGIPKYTSLITYLENLQPFEVYPNPASDTLVITAGNPDQTPNCSIEMVSHLGQLVTKSETSFSWSDNIFHADISSLAAGVYYLKLVAGEKKFVYRIVKKE